MQCYINMQIQSLNVTGLSPYQVITVTIAAINGAGMSNFSNQVSTRTRELGMSYMYSYNIIM